jgi:hypothetical protein
MRHWQGIIQFQKVFFAAYRSRASAIFAAANMPRVGVILDREIDWRLLLVFSRRLPGRKIPLEVSSQQLTFRYEHKHADQRCRRLP